MMIIVTANIFGMFTTCQALGLELCRYYPSILIPVLLESHHYYFILRMRNEEGEGAAC